MLLHDLLINQALNNPEKKALGVKKVWMTYQELSALSQQYSKIFCRLSMLKGQRIAVYLPKNFEAVISYFATSLSGGIFVPVNPILKARQVEHILSDCNASVLITNKARFKQLNVKDLIDLKYIILTDGLADVEGFDLNQHVINWQNLRDITDTTETDINMCLPDLIDTDIAAIFYTSGSTGNAKGVVLSHRNLVMGANSVASYLPCLTSDIMLAVQPFSFDYGFSQLSIAFLIGASCYMQEYLFERELLKTIVEQQVTTLALVPPLWIKLAHCEWPESIQQQIRYFCNTGGVLPTSTLSKLRQLMPAAQPYLMYGLTEAFRSCYLPPEQIDLRVNSFGKAIPNAHISVINEQGQECQAFEPGELVHRGVLVAQGYWNDCQRTAERFKPAPNMLPQVPLTEMAVWSGDIVHKDKEGYLYFVSRKDEMIKSSGYRISPQEVEDVLYQLNIITEAIVIGLPHNELGQALLIIAVADGAMFDVDTDSEVQLEKEILEHCLKYLPNYMQPKKVILTDTLPRNSNGKFDRRFWQNYYQNLFVPR